MHQVTPWFVAGPVSTRAIVPVRSRTRTKDLRRVPRGTTPSGAGPVLGVQVGRPRMDVADLLAQLRRREDLGVIAPRDAPQPDLDRPAHDGAPLQRAVGQPLR